MQQVLQLVNRATKESLVVHSARSAKIVQQEPFKNKIRCQAQSAKLVQLVGNNRLKEHHHALALIGRPKRVAKKPSTSTIHPPILLSGPVSFVQLVAIVPFPVLGKIFDQSLDGGKFLRLKEILKQIKYLPNACTHLPVWEHPIPHLKANSLMQTETMRPFSATTPAAPLI